MPGFRAQLLLFVLLLLVPLAVMGQSPRFVRHDINPDSIYGACAAIDVNRDGRLDIVAGGDWYEAPHWKRHFLREVEMIRGRYDDYSNLPLDVNGDGWMDLVSCNYRSKSIYWVEHPGPELGTWKTYVIDTPGSSETGRLVDIDGDGRLDVLPNGTQFAAWWEVAKSDGNEHPIWTRHDLPDELAGHGIGFGDIDGDGRGDLVGPNGWAAAPTDRRGGRWRWHAEFQLHRDCGIPILVLDVDADGDQDIVWGRGHQTGLYWLEQTRDPADNRLWTKHAIDTSWSQPHSLELADINNDGKLDVVAGKRYLGHDGKDLGEYDPLVIYWYSFDHKLGTWHRGSISPASRAGFGLDPKVIDIDGDGDVDVLASGRSGLYLFENQLLKPSSIAPVAEPMVSYPADSPLLVVRDNKGVSREVQSAADWGNRRHHILGALRQVMGPLPDSSQRVPLGVEVVQRSEFKHYVRQHVLYSSEPGDRVPAYLLMPRQLRDKTPAILCLHPDNPRGKDSICGSKNSPNGFAHELANRGYICLVPDYPGYGQYQPYDHDADRHASGTMIAIWNNVRGLDLLESIPEVDTEKLAVVGSSLGGYNALFTAPFDLRIKAVIASCDLSGLHEYRDRDTRSFSSDHFMPRIRNRDHSGLGGLPFDFPEVLAAIAPRPLLIRSSHTGTGGHQATTNVVNSAANVYELLGSGAELQSDDSDARDNRTETIGQAAHRWLDKQF